MAELNAYREIVGDDIIEELYLLSEKLSETVIQNVNSTTFSSRGIFVTI